MEVSISQQITFPDWLWFLTKLNCCLLDLALALLDSEGDDVQVHADAAQLDILGGTTALLVAAVLHLDSVPIQHEYEAAGAGSLPHFHLFASKGILEKYLFLFLGPRGPFIEPLPVHPSTRPATIFHELIDELKHCRQASGTPQMVYFLKAHDVSYPNSDKNFNTETNTKTNRKTRQIQGEAETHMV